MLPLSSTGPSVLGSCCPLVLGASLAPALSPSSRSPVSFASRSAPSSTPRRSIFSRAVSDGSIASTPISEIDDPDRREVAEGYTTNQFCDRIISYFLNEKPQTKDWRKILVFREDWKKYRDHFYRRCREQAVAANDPVMKQKLIALSKKVKKIDNEIEKHMELLKEIEEAPSDINAIVARRRKKFSREFFRHLNMLPEIYDNLDKRDAIVRLGARCLSAVRAYDCALEEMDFDDAQSKFDDILNSSSLEDACEKIESLAKAKELKSSLILLINRAWAAALESKSMKSEVKHIMHQIYETTNKSLKSLSPPEIKLVKYLLDIADPEERFAALATAFCPGDEHNVKDPNTLHTTPKELHKWIKIMLDAYLLSKEETDMLEARQMSDPMVIQRLNILKVTIEEEYMKVSTNEENKEDESEDRE